MKQFLRLDEGVCWTLWRAVGKSEWSAAKEWRAAVIAFDRRPLHQQTPADVEGFLQEWATPQKMVALIEDLKHQALLSRRDGRTIEEAVLQMVRADGQWK